MQSEHPSTEFPPLPGRGFIYALKDPGDASIRYVGFTSKSLKARLTSHLKDRNPSHRKNWITSLKAKQQRPIIELVADISLDEWGLEERKWIKHFKDIGCELVNHTEGGEGILGFRHSAETREFLRQNTLKQFESPEARAAVSRQHAGKAIGEEHKKVVGVAAKKRWKLYRESGASMSKEARAILREKATGRVVSDETKVKLSAVGKGKPKTAEHRAKLAEHCRRMTAARLNKTHAPK